MHLTSRIFSTSFAKSVSRSYKFLGLELIDVTRSIACSYFFADNSERLHVVERRTNMESYCVLEVGYMASRLCLPR
ncbi:hypothetical protein QLX08_004159 [Tetragonisca angustula]|uniref:Uncharacterized protein n=1 Tax=Tetragonisca angustula TaxID=166442 RepID=A0AAW1A3C2_9HYME